MFSVSEQVSFGSIPPRKAVLLDTELVIGVPADVPAAPIILARKRASSYVKLIYAEWYGLDTLSDSINLYVSSCKS